MEKSLLKQDVMELEINVQEWSFIMASMLHDLMNESRTFMNDKGIVTSSPIEKLNYLIKELEKMRYEIEKLDLLYEIEYEILK